MVLTYLNGKHALGGLPNLGKEKPRISSGEKKFRTTADAITYTWEDEKA